MARLRKKNSGGYVIKGKGSAFYTLQVSDQAIEWLSRRGINLNNTVPTNYIRKLLNDRLVYTTGGTKSFQEQLDHWSKEDDQKAKILMQWGEDDKNFNSSLEDLKRSLAKLLNIFQPQLSAADVFTNGFIEHVFQNKPLYGLHLKLKDKKAFHTLNFLKKLILHAHSVNANTFVVGINFDRILLTLLNDFGKTPKYQQSRVKNIYKCSNCGAEIVRQRPKQSYKKKCPNCNKKNSKFEYIKEASACHKVKKGNNRKKGKQPHVTDHRVYRCSRCHKDISCHISKSGTIGRCPTCKQVTVFKLTSPSKQIAKKAMKRHKKKNYRPSE